MISMWWNTFIEYFPDWKIWCQAIATMLIAIGVFIIHKYIFDWGKAKTINRQQKTNEKKTQQISGNYDIDLNNLRNDLAKNGDVNFREFRTGLRGSRAVLIFVEGMQDESQINKHVMRTLMDNKAWSSSDGYLIQSQGDAFTAYLKEKLLSVSKISEVTDLYKLEESILLGFTALLVDGMPHALLVGEPQPKVRSTDEPTSEALLRGPRVGFTEVLGENTALLRQHGQTAHLVLKMVKVGKEIERNLVIAYMDDIVNPELLKEVEDRIANIDIDFVAESGYIEQFIEDDWLSPFQQLQNTERPDRVINALLAGRIGILLDGTPFALIAPVTFSMLLQSPEDYYERWLPSTLLRSLRFFVAFLALMTPAMYISFISFHPGLIPTELAITIIETRQGVPFPSLIEVLILEISIEILREAGIRLPKPIGPAMGIVGGLIIGDAAVQAGIVSPILVISVAVTAISSFAIPMYSAGITLRMLRFAGMLFAAVLGMFGTILFFLFICSHLTKLKSFGVPYVTPITPYRFSDWKDVILRAPIPLMKSRPIMMKTQNKKRKS